MGYFTPLLIAAFVASATAVPPGPRYTCANTCSDGTKFAYEKGMSYEYTYNVDTTTADSPPTDFDRMASTSITSKATIAVLAPCEYMLTLSDVDLKGSSQSSAFSADLTKTPLRFAFDDGRISGICSEPNEEAWATNFKRGVLSAFQNSMTKLDEDETLSEVDVTGECEADYRVTSSSTTDVDTTVIERTKSSRSCKRMAVAAHTRLPEPLQRLPLLSAEQMCTQTISDGFIQKAECVEMLRLRPMSAGGGGATTSIKTVLALVDTKLGLSYADFELAKSTLEFDGNFSNDKSDGHFYTIEAILNELDQKSLPSLKSEVPALFSQLVETLRHLDQRQLTLLYEANRGTRVWRFLVDAAPMVATPAAMNLVANLITSGQMTEQEADVWFTSLAFLPDPQAEMFLPLSELLVTQSTKSALLGISAMINKYCVKDSSCMELNTVREVLTAIEVKLGTACRSTNLEEKEFILLTLKALGNAGHWLNSDVMEKCYIETENPAEVRVAALEAWRRAPCSYDRSGLMRIFTDSRQDSEIRIAAYLSLMACPTQQLIDNIKDRLTSERVNQVGSFVWTHLSNLQETASHEKQWIRALIGEENLMNKFNESALHLSRNYESSMYMEEQGFGTTVESNVIFSGRSFLPRSGMFNLTFDFFGESINLLEIGGRFEGFEIFAEKFFGPNGYYPEETVEGILKSLRKSNSNQENTLEELLDVVTDEPEGSYYLRLFGNDVQYHHFRGIENFFEEKPDFDLIKILKEFAKNGKVDSTKSYKIMDTELTYPTMSGLPISLKLNSTATFGMRMDGKFLFRSFSDMDIEGHIYPSAVVEVDATMLVDAHVSKSGLKVSSNIKTSAFIDGKIKIEGGNIVDIALNMPENSVQLFNFKTEKVIIEDNIEKPVEVEERSAGSCLDLTTVLGIRMCANIDYDQYSTQSYMSIEKTDSHSGYKFRFLREPQSVSFLIDTPNSAVDRKFSLVAIKDEEEVKIDIHTPWKSMKATGSYQVADGRNHFELDVIADSTNKYKIAAGYSMMNDGFRIKFEPTLLVQSTANVIVDAVGSFELDPQLQNIKLSAKNTGLMPATIEFSSSSTDGYKVDGSVSTSMWAASASGIISHRDGFTSQADIKYGFVGQPDKTISHSLKLQKSITDERKAYTGAFHLQMSQLPEYSLNTKGQLIMSDGRLETSGSFNYGGDVLDLSTDNTIIYSFTDESLSYDMKMAVTSTSLGIDSLLTEKFRLTRNYILREAYLRLTPRFELRSKTEIGYSQDIEGFARVHIEIPGQTIALESSYTKIADKYYTAQVLGNLDSKRWVFDGTYQDRSISGESVELEIGLKSRINEKQGGVDMLIKADRNGMLFNAKSNFDGTVHFAKIKATPTTLELDANIIKHITLNAQVTPEGPTKSVEVKGTWDKQGSATEIRIQGELSASAVAGQFKYGDIEKSFRGEIDGQGAMIRVNFGPSKQILGQVTYDFTQGLRVSATLETPFSSYEKQNAMFSYIRVGAKEFSSQISITWRNSQILAFNANGKIKSNITACEMTLSASFICDQTIFGFERSQFSLSHQMNDGMNVNSSISGVVDGKEIINGMIKSTFTEKNTNVVAKLVTPITDDVLFKVDRTLFKKASVQLRYGPRDIFSSTYDLSDLPNGEGYQLVFKLSSSLSPDITLLSTLKNIKDKILIEIDGNYGDSKYNASFNFSKQRNSSETILLATGRIILPLMTPITGSLTATFTSSGKVALDIEMTRFWSSYGTVKIHSDYIFNSITENQGTMSVISPDVRVTINSVFKLNSNELTSFIKCSLNGIQYGITANGIIDIPNRNANVRASSSMDDKKLFSADLEYDHKQETKVTKLKIRMGDRTYDIAHQLTFNDKFNWINKLEINDFIYNSELSTLNNIYNHKFDWHLKDKFVRGEVFISDITQYQSRITAGLNMSSTWTSDLKIEFESEIGQTTYKPKLLLEYGNNFSAALECTCMATECSVKFDLRTPIWEKIKFKGVYKMSSPKALTLSLTQGSRHVNMDITSICTDEEKFISIQMDSSYLHHPVKIEGGFMKSDDETSLLFTLNSEKMYKGKLAYTTLSWEGKISLEMEIPDFKIEKSNFVLDYNFAQLPSELRLILELNKDTYGLTGLLNQNTLNLNIIAGYLSSKAESSWNVNSENGNVMIKIESLNNDSANVEANLVYDISNKMINFVSKYNSETFMNVFGKIQAKAGTFETKLSIMDINNTISASYDESHFEIKGDIIGHIVEIKGDFNKSTNVGQLAMNITSTFVLNVKRTATIKFTMKYDFSSNKSVEFKAAVLDKEISFIAMADVSDWAAPKVSLETTSFIQGYERIGGYAQYDLRTETKKCEVELYRNSHKLLWQLEATSEQAGVGNAILRFTSPIISEEKIEYGIDYAFTVGVYEATIYHNTPSQRNEYSVKITLGSNSIEAEFTSPSKSWNKVTLKGNFENDSNKLRGVLHMMSEENIWQISGELTKDVMNPVLNVVMKAPHTTVTFDGTYNISDREQLFKASLATDRDTYSIDVSTKMQYKQGEIKTKLVTPFNGYKSVGFNGNFNFLGDIKTATIEFELNGRREYMSSNLQINDNNVKFELETPFEAFAHVKFTGDMTLIDGKRSVIANIQNGSEMFSATGELNLSDMYFKLKMEIPREGYGSMEVTGKRTSTGYLLNYSKSSSAQEIILDYIIEPTAASFKIQTPFDGYRIAAIEYMYQSRPNSLIASMNFEKEDVKFNFEGKVKYSDLKSSLIVRVNIPVIEQSMVVNANYDFTGNAKSAEIFVKHNTFMEKLQMMIRYDINSAAIKISIPFINEDFSAEYVFNVDRINRSFNGSFLGQFGADSYEFTAQANLLPNGLTITFTTPVSDFEKIHIDGIIDFSQKKLKGELLIGSYQSKIDISYELSNIFIEIVSPFEIIKQFKVSSNFIVSDRVNKISLSAIYNDMRGGLTVKYEPYHREESIYILLWQNEEQYKLSAGGYLEDQKASMSMKLSIPLKGLHNLQFRINLDFANVDKALEITLINENDVKMIAINGKVIGDLFDVNLRSSLNGLENLRTYGSLSRSKRSLEFDIMNDSSQGSIRASFNSLTVKVRSPYAAARESSLEITKPNEGGLVVHYKRGDNFVDITASPTGTRQTFDVAVNTAFPGWEFLAISGRLDKDELVGYLSGQINEAKMTIQGSGTYGRTESNLKFDVTTPYANYETVSISFSHNVRRKDFNLEAKSPSSNFRVIIKTKPNLTIDIFVPNSVEPTIIKGTLNVFNGNLSVKSRFPKWRSFNLQYNVVLGQDNLDITSRIESNNVEIFNLEFKRGGGKAHLKIDARRGENHSMLHFHRVGYESAEFVFHRNGKEFKAEAQGTGNLPEKGVIDVVINNSFRDVPRTVNAHFDIDRTGSPKKIKLELTYPGKKLYIFDLKYNIDLGNTKLGDYTLSITTPDRRAHMWNNISGKWNFSDHNNSMLEVSYGDRTHVARGKFGLFESNIHITSTIEYFNDYHIEYRFQKETTATERIRDHYIKIGNREKFVMVKVKGRFSGLKAGDAEFAIQISRIMSNPLNFTLKWHHDDTGLTGEGTFNSAQRNGTFRLKKLKRTAEIRSAVISLEASTNIPNYTHVTVEGSYSFDNQAKLDLDITWDTSKIAIHFDITDITSEYTEQTASFSLPNIGDVTVTFGHDFRNKKVRKFTAIGQLMGKESHLKAEWNRNKDFTKLSGNVDIQSILLGHITIEGNYDVRNLNNAKAEIKYTRNSDKHVHIKWERKFTANELNAEILFESHFQALPNAKISVHATFQQGVDFTFLAQGGNKEIKLTFQVQPNSITGEFVSPIPGFENVTGSFTYEISDRKKKTATLRYTRGDRVITMDMNLDMPSRKEGSLTLKLETPFEFVRTLSLDAKWKNKRGEVHYTRNDIVYHFTGEAEVKTERTSFEIQFTPSSGDPIKISFNFNAEPLLAGTATEPGEIAEVELELVGKRFAFEVKGFRNAERLMIEFDADSSLEAINEFKIKLDSELNTEKRNGLFEIQINEFHFKVRNYFERRPENGYYWKSEFDSTLTDLPGLTIGFGKEGEQCILTVGVGDDREITVAFAPKGNFANGFSGKLSLPRRGIVDAAFDVSYNFSGEDILNIAFQIQIEPGKVIEADIVYNSDGVRGRLTSPRTGRRTARLRRSITDNGFFAEMGIDDYNLSLRGDMLNAGLKKGFLIEGEIFGTKVSVDALVQRDRSEYVEGKFIVKTSIAGYETLGGLFTLTNIDKQIHGRFEINLPSYVTPKVYGNIDLDLNNKLKGLVSLDISGQVYALHLDMNGTLQEGFIGKVMLRTPFHSASQVTLDGQFKMKSIRNLEASFDIDYSLGSMNIQVKYDILPRKYLIETTVKCSNHGINFNAKVDLQMINNIFNSELCFNTHEMIFNYSMPSFRNIKGKLYLKSSYFADPASISFSRDATSASISASIAGETYVVSSKYSKTDRNIEITAMIDCSLIGRHMIAFKHEIPRRYLMNSFSAHLSYTTEATYDISITVDRTTGLKFTFTLDHPNGIYMTEINLVDRDYNTDHSIVIKLPMSEHTATFSWNYNPMPPSELENMIIPYGKYQANVQIQSSYLAHEISYSIKSEITKAKRMSKQILIFNGITHSLETGFSSTPVGVDLVINVATPLFNIEKAGISAELSVNEITRAVVVAELKDQTHIFDVKMNVDDKELTATLKSSLIPGDFAKAVVSVQGQAENELKINVAFKLDDKTLAVKLSVKAPSTSNMESALEVKTPFRGYRKMNFGASYIKDNQVRMMFFADKPIGYKFMLNSGKTMEGYATAIEIKTPIKDFEIISVELDVPMVKIAPKVVLKLPTSQYELDFEVEKQEFANKISGNLNLNGMKCGAGFGLRSKAPYEVSYYYKIQSLFKRHHIMMDSSFFSMLSLFL